MAVIKVLVGLPGSGKSTFVEEMKKDKTDRVVLDFSTDKYPGLYDEKGFHPELLGEAHAATKRSYIEACQTYSPRSASETVLAKSVMLIVDNTNLSTAELGFFVDGGMAYGHDVEVLIFKCNLETSKKRNIHGVPHPTLERMNESLTKLVLPPWWAHSVVDIPDRM